MRLAALSCQPDLLAALLEPGEAIFVRFIDAAGTGYAFAIVRRLEILAAERTAAGVALHVTTLGEIPIHGDTGIEYETFPVPAILVCRDLLEVIKDASLQVINLVEA